MNIRLTSAQKGILCIISSAFFFTVMNLCAKLSGNLPSIQKAFFRNSIACCASIFVLIKNRQFVLPQKKNLLFLILRAMMGTAGLVSNFYAVSHLALADASILAKLAPFFTIFFSFLFLKERIRFTRLLATGAAGAGGQFNVTAAYSYAPAKTSPFSTTRKFSLPRHSVFYCFTKFPTATASPVMSLSALLRSCCF